MNISKLIDADINGKKVFVRADLDVPFEKDETGNFNLRDDSRIVNCLPTFKYLLENGVSKLLVAGHIGAYKGDDKDISTKNLLPKLEELLQGKIGFLEGFDNPDFNLEERVILLENLRLTDGEKENSEEFARKLAALADFYVNESFAVSHRVHASIVGVPKFLPHAAGLRFAKEIEILSGILENPKKPIVAVISGIKEDKLTYIQNLIPVVDRILVGGRLPEYIEKDTRYKSQDTKIVVAQLNPDKEDITIRSIETFEKIIEEAGTVVLAGVPGKYEEEGHRLGTERVFAAIANSSAFKLVGGGDSEAALTLFKLTEKFDWISTGGGAMLDFLTKGTLPGIEALNAV